jgi:general stress protein YciG
LITTVNPEGVAHRHNPSVFPETVIIFHERCHMSNSANQGNRIEQSSPRERGFAAMDAQQQREIARKGGQAVSADRQHMSEIGRKGGEASRNGNRKNTGNTKNTIELL